MHENHKISSNFQSLEFVHIERFILYLEVLTFLAAPILVLLTLQEDQTPTLNPPAGSNSWMAFSAGTLISWCTVLLLHLRSTNSEFKG